MLGRIEVQDKALLELIPAERNTGTNRRRFWLHRGPGLVSRTLAIQRHTA